MLTPFTTGHRGAKGCPTLAWCVTMPTHGEIMLASMTPIDDPRLCQWLRSIETWARCAREKIEQETRA